MSQKDKIQAYTIKKEIGRGTFGVVNLVQEKETGIMSVMKTIDLHDSNITASEREGALTEVNMLKRLRHPFIVGYRNSFLENKRLYIVMWFCQGGDLSSYIQKAKTNFSEEKILSWFVQICLPLKYCHDRYVIHRDLKSQNIFMTKDHRVRLGDFGIARVLNGSTDLAMSVVGTPYSMSPEVCESKPYSYESDVWALGCVLYEMCVLKHAFDANNLLGLVWKIVRDDYPPIPDEYSFSLKSLIKDMLTKNPEKRPSVNDILKKPFIQHALVKLSLDTIRHIRVEPRKGKVKQKVRLKKKKTYESVISPRGITPRSDDSPRRINPTSPSDSSPRAQDGMFPPLKNSVSCHTSIKVIKENPTHSSGRNNGANIDEASKHHGLSKVKSKLKPPVQFQRLGSDLDDIEDGQLDDDIDLDYNVDDDEFEMQFGIQPNAGNDPPPIGLERRFTALRDECVREVGDAGLHELLSIAASHNNLSIGKIDAAISPIMEEPAKNKIFFKVQQLVGLRTMINFKKSIKKTKQKTRKESMVEKSSDTNPMVTLPILPTSPTSVSSRSFKHRYTSSISSDRSSSRRLAHGHSPSVSSGGRHVHGHSSSISSDRLYTPSSRNEYSAKHILKKSSSRKAKSSQRRNKSRNRLKPKKTERDLLRESSGNGSSSIERSGSSRPRHQRHTSTDRLEPLERPDGHRMPKMFREVHRSGESVNRNRDMRNKGNIQGQRLRPIGESKKHLSSSSRERRRTYKNGRMKY